MKLSRLRSTFHSYPRQFWLLMGASFIDMVGNSLVYPFFALYITDKFDVGMTRVGTIFAVFAGAGLVGSTIGGALADKIGRKPVILFGLLSSALGNLAFALVNDINLLYPIALTLGVCGSIGHPAAQAMVADLLPENRRAEGFGIWRIEFNLAVTFGPMIGGLLAGMSYVLLFSVDAVTSLITAAILLVVLRESKPEATAESPAESLVQTFSGYGRVFRDGLFMAFMGIGIAVWIVYLQMNTTLGVYLRDIHGIEPQRFGMILSMNAVMVVLMQFSFTRFITQRAYSPLFVLAAGTLLYAVGFSMYGYVSTFVLFAFAMIIITVGEMIAVPVAQALAAQLARADMRGRYMAVFGFSFSIASGLGTWLAGVVIDNLGFEWVWYFAGIIGTFAALGYIALHYRLVGIGHEALKMPTLDSSPSDAVADVAA